MEYFTDRGGKYVSKDIRKHASTMRYVAALIPLAVLGVWYINAGRSGEEAINPMAIAGIAAVFIGIAFLGEFLRRRGHGAGVTVNQTTGAITFRVPGGQRRGIPRARLDELLLVRRGVSGASPGGIGGVLFLVTDDGAKLHVMQSGDLDKLKRFADELAMLTSATVREEQAE